MRLTIPLKSLFLIISSLLSAGLFAGCGGGDESEELGPGTDGCSVLTKVINGTPCEGPPTAVVRLLIGEASCTGNLISSSQVLTAAHCFYRSVGDLEIETPASQVSLYLNGSGKASALAEQVFIHPDYLTSWATALKVKRSRFQDYVLLQGLPDVAVVNLDRPLNIEPLSIRATGSVARDQVIAIFGYGTTDGNKRVASLDLVSGLMDIEQFGAENFSALFKNGGSDACFGDSGGAALAVDGSRSILGTVALGSSTSCRQGQDQTLFTRLAGARIL